jgi:CRISPR-associated protein Csm3
MSSNIPGHEALRNRYRITGRLKLETPLRISSGRANETTDAPLIRLADGSPYIPGTSLRGALRSELERVIPAVGDAYGLTACTLFTKESCGERFEAYRRHEENAGEDLTEGEITQWAKKELCSVCRLFGCTVCASRLVIHDAVIKGADKGAAVVRDGVGIDRDTGTAREGVKFDYEVLECHANGNVLTGPLCMDVDNLTGQDRTLIGVILALLRDGIQVGGKRAGGLGRLSLAGEPAIKGVTGKDLWERLEAGKPLLQPVDTAWKEVPTC